VKEENREGRGQMGAYVYYTMPFAEKGDLYSMIENSDRFEELFARSLFSQLVEGKFFAF
jgi:serine/threonine protein kinase